VFTTVHARDSVNTIFRLLDLGVERFLVANAVTMTLSQRLVRKLCDHCKRPYRPDGKTIVALGLEGHQIERFYESVGCTQCMDTGFRGRLALFEMLSFNPQLRDVILTKPTIKQIRNAAGEWMFRTLRTSGLAKVADGLTTVEEVERVAGGEA
ncbi:MAG: ATPase, T2SS/T4P/T4SS family, partial [Phycisphaerae bacterium]